MLSRHCWRRGEAGRGAAVGNRDWACLRVKVSAQPELLHCRPVACLQLLDSVERERHRGWRSDRAGKVTAGPSGMYRGPYSLHLHKGCACLPSIMPPPGASIPLCIAQSPAFG